jgi:acyl carrier protein
MTTLDPRQPFDPHRHVAAALEEVAPDVEPHDLDADFHDVLGLDSMDTLNLAAAIGRSTGIDIPERDFPELRTIRELEAYLGRRYGQREQEA